MLKLNITVVSVFLLCFLLSACGFQHKSNASRDSKSDTLGSTEQQMDSSLEHGSEEIDAKESKLSIAQVLTENNHLPVEERVALYRRLKEEHPNDYNFGNEDEMTMYGYSLLWNELTEEAIAIFALIVEQFPNSSNPYDSLGEAYMVNGNKELAIANYEKSLELNPENFNAEDQIERMKFPEKALEKPTEKFAKVFTAKAYKEDLDQLGQKILEVHPNALKFISKAEFLKTIEEKKALITDQTTYGEFTWHCSEIIASINCSHSSMGRFNQESEMLPLSLRFPLQVRWVDEKLFVIDPLNNEAKIAIKDEILSINGLAVSALIADIYQHISSQGYVETTKKHAFNTWATGMIPYALGFPTSYELVIKGKDAPVVLNKAERFKNLYRDPSIKSCGDDLCLEIRKESNIAIMTIASFNYYPWGNLDVFVDFIDRSFKEISEEGITNLIIDVRFNGGGSSESSIHLLKYLSDRPFTYYSLAEYEGKEGPVEGEQVQLPQKSGFAGKCYFIIDGNGNSTTGHFMSMVKALKLGTIVGEELGSNQFCSAGQKICRLPNTRLEYYLANNTHVTTATMLPVEKGILPDHYVTQGIDDYLNNVDTVKEFTIRLIQGGR